jgi:hypothetical protein
MARAIAAPRLRNGFVVGLGASQGERPMTAVELADPVDTIIARAQKPSRQGSKHRKLQWRLERYASTGPNCPNGHPWSENAKFTYHGYRFCDACAREKAEKRRNDPMTYTGACPQGHAYTRENTKITCWNAKFCVACCRKPDAKPRPLQPGQMEELLRRARRGETTSELSGEGGPKHRGKGIISRVRLLAACSGDTPESRELKTLLKQNGDAAVGNGRPEYRWSQKSLALLTAEYEKGLPSEEIVGLINEKFDRDFTVGAIYTKASKLGLERPARIIMPKSVEMRRIQIIPKLPPLTTALRFPIGSLLDRINAVVPRYLARDHRDDVIGDMVLAVYEGRLEEADIERRVGEFVNVGYRRDHDKHKTVSLDVPLFDGSELRGIDRITTGLWQSESTWQ